MQLSKLLRSLSFAVLCLAALTGCVTQSTPQDRLPEFSVISVQMPGFTPTHGESVAWLRDAVIIGEFTEELEGQINNEISASVERGLRDQGFTAPVTGGSDYVLLAALITGISDELSDAQRELIDISRLYPMLGGGTAYERNMLVLAITTQEKVGDGNPLWKAAIEVYAAGDADLSDANRRQRLDGAVNKLLATLPDMAY